MKIYKFIIHKGQWTPDLSDPALSWEGCLAVAVAPDEASAREAVRRYGSEFGKEVRWLPSARAVEIPIDEVPKCVAWAMT